MLKPDNVRSGESPGNTVNILVVINRLKGKLLLGRSFEAINPEFFLKNLRLESIYGVLRHDFENFS